MTNFNFVILKFCMQPSIRHPFALANFQLGRKGQRPKGRKVKRPNFQKLSEAFLIKSKVVPNVFMSIFKLKGPISRNFALELIVKCWFNVIFFLGLKTWKSCSVYSNLFYLNALVARLLIFVTQAEVRIH